MADPAFVSVVVATYNRGERLADILGDLSRQTLGRHRFEVVLLDDGSKAPVDDVVAPFRDRLDLTLHRQTNQGVGAARTRGAELAKGDLLVFLDDDMRLPDTLLESHRAAHAPREDSERGLERRVILGRLRGAEDAERKAMPLFERFHLAALDQLSADVASGAHVLDGSEFYTGNVSMPRALFFELGGFDRTLTRGEDTDFGVRLHKAGVPIALSEEAYTVNLSDHASAGKWLERSSTDGRCASQIAKKHPDAPYANPWRYMGQLNPISRPILASVVAIPGVARPLARGVYGAANAVDGLGLEGFALRGATLAYGIQYFAGVRGEAGSLGSAMRDFRAFRRAYAEATSGASGASLAEAIRADHAALARTQERYGGKEGAERGIAADAVTNIGFQLLVGYRLMRAFVAGGHGVAAKFTSRLLRHLYGSDIHWDAVFEPGIVVVHGFGLAINGDTYVSAGSILFQHVTLGRGLHPETRAAGSPRLEPNVHVGVGATLVGPIVVGRNTKIMPGCVVTRDVPPDSVVAAPEPELRTRGKRPG